MFKIMSVLNGDWERMHALNMAISDVQLMVDWYKETIEEFGDPYGDRTEKLNKYSEELERLKNKKKALS